MSLKPTNPRKHRPARTARPAGMPVVLVQKKPSGSGGWVLFLLLLVAAVGGYFVYKHQLENEAALAARQQKLEENARKVEEARRQMAEHENLKRQSDGPTHTAMGTVGAPSATSSATAGVSADTSSDYSDESFDDDDSSDPAAEDSALGSTTLSGGLAATDTSAPVYDLRAEGKASLKVAEKLAKALDAAAEGDTFHDLQADLKRSFEVAYPGLFADSSTLPPFPDQKQKLLRIAQGVYVCLNLAAELDARDTVPAEKHAKFVNWLMKDKAKAARTFTYGLEHCGISDVATATEHLDKLRATYIKTPSSALKKIPTILKTEAGE